MSAPEQAANIKRKREEDADSCESRSTDGSDNGSDLEGFVVEEEDSTPAPTENDEELAVKEAQAFVGPTPPAAITVGRYTLRDRSKIKKVEVYFDAENAAIVAKNQDKAEMLQALKKWRASEEYVGEVELKKSATYDQVCEEYMKAKDHLGLPDSDEESEEEEEEEEDEDEEPEDEDEESESESEDDEEDEDDKDDDDDEEDEEDEDEEEESDEDGESLAGK